MCCRPSDGAAILPFALLSGTAILAAYTKPPAYEERERSHLCWCMERCHFVWVWVSLLQTTLPTNLTDYVLNRVFSMLSVSP